MNRFRSCARGRCGVNNRTVEAGVGRATGGVARPRRTRRHEPGAAGLYPYSSRPQTYHRRCERFDHTRSPRAVMGSGVEAGGEAGADFGPFGVEDGEIDGVALVAADVHVLTECTLADRTQTGQGLLRSNVAPVGLQGDAHAAEGLEAMPQEEVFRFRIGRRAPVVAGQERGADFDLPVERAHVEQTRRADRAARRLPALREDDRLTASHHRPGLADQLEALVEPLRRRPGEVAADLLVLHRVEDVPGVMLGERLEDNVAPLERDGLEKNESVYGNGRPEAGVAERRGGAFVRRRRLCAAGRSPAW